MKFRSKDSPWYKLIRYGLEYFGRFYGTYRAFVANNEDPENMNRLQLIIPTLNPTAIDETWAWPQNVMGGKNYGTQLLPQKGDMVWVNFENGDPDYPTWKHAGYGEDELPEEFSSTRHYGFKTPGGTLLLINDNKDQEEILVRLNNGEEWIKIKKEELEHEAKLIKLGKEAQESVILGDMMVGYMEDMLEQIVQQHKILRDHVHPSSGAPVTTDVQLEMTYKLSRLAALQNQLKKTLSKKVKVDK